MFPAGRHQRRSRPFLIEACEPRTLLTSYYISPTGSDSYNGTSSTTPWKSITKINAVNLEPGDKVLFQGGATFNAPAVSSTNQISDSGFESGNLNSWTKNFDATSGNSAITSTASDIKSGSKALKVSGSTAGGRGQVVTSKLSANKSYILKLWAKLSSGSGSAFGGITFYKGGNEVADASFRISGTSYKEYSAALVAPPTFDSAEVWVTKDAGTSVLCVDDFKLNESYSTIVLDSTDSGTAALPVTIGSYGSGRATLNVGDGYGLSGYNVSGLVIDDLIFAGTWDGLAATGTNGGSGIAISNRLSANAKLDYIRIDNVEARNFKWAGISVSGDNGKAGYRDVRITNSSAHDNGDIGIRVEGSFSASSATWSHSDVYVGWCKVYNNGGLPNKNSNSGNGILIGDTDGAVVERSIAWNNGQNCNYTGGGPVGIWAWDSNDVTIQYNEAYNNKTGSVSLDGGGFDLDGGCTNSVMQYNYSHDNDGAGYLIYQFTGARPMNNNTIRYNISQNDGRDGHYGGIYLGGGSGVQNTHAYGNTIYLSPGPNSAIAAIKITGVGSGNKFRNNIFYTTGGVRLLDSNSAYSTSNVQFQGNDWYASGGGFSIKWGGTTYTDLSAWRGSGQEKNGATNTGISSDPKLVAPGGGTTLGDAALLNSLTAYQLLSNSPAINAGVNLTSLGVNAGGKDYYGSNLYSGANFDIGGFESTSSLSGSTGDDDYLMRVGPSGAVELFINTPVTDEPTVVFAKGVYANYAIAGNGGDDTMTLDLSGGSPLPTGGASFNGGAQNVADALIVTGTAGNDTVAVSSSNVTPGGSGPALSYTGVGDVTVDTGSGNDTLLFANPNADVDFVGGAGTDTLTINSGTYVFTHDAALDTPNLSVNVTPNGNAVFNASQHLASLTITGNASIAPGGDVVINTRALNVYDSGDLDINDNAIVVDYSGATPMGGWDEAQHLYTGIIGRVYSGHDDHSWQGQGIKSSVAAQNSVAFGIGVAEASDVLYLQPGETATFAGETIDATTILIRFGFSGDTDMNGEVNGDDYFRADSSITAGLNGFSNGDINFDGIVDAGDFAELSESCVFAAGRTIDDFLA